VVISGEYSTNPAAFEDKEFLAVDTTGGTYNGRVYVAWTEFTPSNDAQIMLAASSSTSPLAFSPSVVLSAATANDQHGAIPAVAPDGSVYVVWSTLTNVSTAAPATVNLLKSTNGGASFASPVTVASFTSTISTLTTGSVSIRTRSFPYLAIDRTPSGSPTRGNMYVVFQGQPTSSASPRSEIFFTSSTDGGATWLPPRDISSGLTATIGADTTKNDNWMPSISVSPVTGHIKVLFYSRREDSANQKVRVYLAGSTDAGMTFYNQSYSAVDFTPSDNYDPLLVSTYMGDYIYAFADSNGLIGAWGDTRNLCAPPSGATDPCSPSGRGDQDVWSKTQIDATGVDLAITPWGAVTGVGATWQSPDIFVVNGSGTEINAELGVVNLLRARIRNLGNAAATGAVVKFYFTTWYASSIPTSDFELIGSVTVNVPAGGAPQIVPINWNMTNLSDTNGGKWPAPISTFNHFCVRVEIDYPSDINLSNNDAQSNFLDVTVATAPIGPIHFIIKNPLKTAANLQIVSDKFPTELQGVIKAPVITIPKLIAPTGNEAVAPAVAPKPQVAAAPSKEVAILRTRTLEGTIQLAANEAQIGTITLTPLPASATEHLTQDLVENVSTVINGKVIGGFSILLAKANTPAPKPVLDVNTVSRNLGAAAAIQVPPVEPHTLTVPTTVAATHQSVVTYFKGRKISIRQNIPAQGLLSAGAITLSHAGLLAAVPEAFQKSIPADATGRYFVTVKTTEGAVNGTTPSSNVVISVRILVAKPNDFDSPLNGRLVPSNGSLEQSFLDGLKTQLKLK
jgi:hypothetical protein